MNYSTEAILQELAEETKYIQQCTVLMRIESTYSPYKYFKICFKHIYIKSVISIEEI